MMRAERGSGAIEYVPDPGELLELIDRLTQQLRALTQRVEQLERGNLHAVAQSSFCPHCTPIHSGRG